MVDTIFESGFDARGASFLGPVDWTRAQFGQGMNLRGATFAAGAAMVAAEVQAGFDVSAVLFPAGLNAGKLKVLGTARLNQLHVRETLNMQGAAFASPVYVVGSHLQRSI